MIWQDYVFAAGQWLFAFALMPTLFGPQKPSRSTCVMTAAIIYGYAVTFGTLGMWMSVWASVTCGACWSLLALQARPSNAVLDKPS